MPRQCLWRFVAVGGLPCFRSELSRAWVVPSVGEGCVRAPGPVQFLFRRSRHDVSPPINGSCGNHGVVDRHFGVAVRGGSPFWLPSLVFCGVSHPFHVVSVLVVVVGRRRTLFL